MSTRFLAKHSGHTFVVHVTPRSGRDVVSGVRDDDRGRMEVAVRVTAAPTDGQANKAVCKLIAASIGVSKTSVSIVAGASSRRKTVVVDCPLADFEAWMAALPRL